MLRLLVQQWRRRPQELGRLGQRLELVRQELVRQELVRQEQQGLRLRRLRLRRLRRLRLPAGLPSGQRFV